MKTLLAVGLMLMAMVCGACAQQAPPKGPVLGYLVGRDYIITIRGGGELRYTLASKDGHILQQDMNARELQTHWPEAAKIVEEGQAHTIWAAE